MAVKHLKYDGNDFIISYKMLNPKEEKDLIILHGWGSNKEIMEQAFLNSFKEYRHIYIDLPGFGGSTNDTMVLKFFTIFRNFKYFFNSCSFKTKPYNWAFFWWQNSNFTLS